MDGMAVISRGLASGRKKEIVEIPVENLGINIEIQDEENIAVAVENEIGIAVEVE
jgi:hypothetical protein